MDEVKVYSWHLVKCGSMGSRDYRSPETLPSAWEMCLVLDAKEENGSIVTFIQLKKQLHNWPRMNREKDFLLPMKLKFSLL